MGSSHFSVGRGKNVSVLLKELIFKIAFQIVSVFVNSVQVHCFALGITVYKS